MTYYGEFTDYSQTQRYKVTIATPTGASKQIIDPFEVDNWDDKNIVMFAQDPVHIKCERTDLTQLIMIAQASITLKVRKDMSNELFADTNRSISVKIEKIQYGYESKTLFFGYVDPLQFNQGFAYDYEEVTVNATDPLGALLNLKVDSLSYNKSDTVAIPLLLNNIFETIFNSDDSLYDGIKVYFPDNIDITELKINMSTFFGDDPDDYMSLYDVLNEILKYIGFTCSYEPMSKKIELKSLYDVVDQEHISVEWFDPKLDNMSDSGNISTDTAYNKIKLTCDIEPSDDDIELLNKDSMYSDYDTYQKYMTELISEGRNVEAYYGYAELMLSPDGEETSSVEKAYRIDRYCYVKRSKEWTFNHTDFNPSYIEYMNGSQEDGTEMTGDQSDVLRWLKREDNGVKAAFVAFGKGNKTNARDNSPQNNVPLTDYLVIGINGHNDHRTDGDTGAYHTNHNHYLTNKISEGQPLCTYSAGRSINLTPTDSSMTNYIVISGKMILNMLQPKTGLNWGTDAGYPSYHGLNLDKIFDGLYNRSLNTYTNSKSHLWDRSYGAIIGYDQWTKTIPFDCEGDNAYYQQKWWKCSDPLNPVYTLSSDGVYDYLDNKKLASLKYEYTIFDSPITLQVDSISKLPILACQMKIGDKYCVERLDLGLEGQGKFEWMTYEEWQQSTLGSFGVPYFTIGIDPKIGDNIVGVSHNISNNIEHTMNVDASGTAIPITINDKVNGEIDFSILGPINHRWYSTVIFPLYWVFGDNTWAPTGYWVLELLQSILVSDLKIEFKSNNGGLNESKTTADNDLVYVSDTLQKYDDTLECDLKICTPLTIQECDENGIKYQISNSYVMDANGDPFYGWTDTPIKPERLFIDYYFKQYKEPAKILDFVVDNGLKFGAPTTDGTYLGFASVLSKYTLNMTYPGLANDNYYVMSMDWSLQEDTNEMKTRQMLEYSNPFE